MLVLSQLAGCAPVYGRARYGYGYGYGYGYAPYRGTYYDPYGAAYYPYGAAYRHPSARGYPAGGWVNPSPRVIVAPPAYRGASGGSGVIVTPQGRGPVYGPR